VVFQAGVVCLPCSCWLHVAYLAVIGTSTGSRASKWVRPAGFRAVRPKQRVPLPARVASVRGGGHSSKKGSAARGEMMSWWRRAWLGSS